MMLRVVDSNIRAYLLMHLIEQLERGDLPVLLEKGACPMAMDRLRNMSLSDVLHLASSGHPDIHFSIDESGFELGISTLERRKNEREDLIYFMQHGASQSMINDCFPATDPRVIQSFREMLKSDRKPGRVSLPDEDMRDAIHKTWHDLQAMQDQLPLRARLRRLHEAHPQFTMDVLFATINEFNERKSNAKK
jgi:hypothetical protein